MSGATSQCQCNYQEGSVEVRTLDDYSVTLHVNAFDKADNFNRTIEDAYDRTSLPLREYGMKVHGLARFFSPDRFNAKTNEQIMLR